MDENEARERLRPLTSAVDVGPADGREAALAPAREGALAGVRLYLTRPGDPETAVELARGLGLAMAEGLGFELVEVVGGEFV